MMMVEGLGLLDTLNSATLFLTNSYEKKKRTFHGQE
jgi:hypothetical protein